jgi:hypothetical protein
MDVTNTSPLVFKDDYSFPDDLELAPAVLVKLSEMPMVDVHLPTTDGRTLFLNRYTEDHFRALRPERLTSPPSAEFSLPLMENPRAMLLRPLNS